MTPSSPTLAMQVLTSFLLLAGAGGSGLLAAVRLSRIRGLPTSTAIGSGLLLGLAGVGLLTLVAGHLGALGPWLPWIIAAGGAAAAVRSGGRAVGLIRAATATARREAAQRPLLALTFGLAGSSAVAASLAAPTRVDEVEYHWPAPLEWAAAGQWIDSSYRHVDAFPLMEVLYTAAATQQSYIAAHLLSLCTLVALAIVATGAASSIGVDARLPVAAAAVVMPVIWDAAYAAYNDTPATAFTVAAAAIALGLERPTRSGVAAMALLLAAAISIKPTSAVAVGCVAIILWARFGRRSVRGSVALVGAALFTVAFWTVRQRVMTGNWIDPLLVQPPSEDAQSRLPSGIQRLLGTVVPFVSGVIGSREPWGGRTSTVIQTFLVPALAYVVTTGRTAARRFALVAGPAYLHWLVLGVMTVRTRFHGFTWVLLIVALAYAAQHAGRRWPRLAPWLDRLWSAAVVLAVVDVSFEMWRAIASLGAP